ALAAWLPTMMTMLAPSFKAIAALQKERTAMAANLFKAGSVDLDDYAKNLLVELQVRKAMMPYLSGAMREATDTVALGQRWDKLMAEVEGLRARVKGDSKLTEGEFLGYYGLSNLPALREWRRLSRSQLRGLSAAAQGAPGERSSVDQATTRKMAV